MAFRAAVNTLNLAVVKPATFTTTITALCSAEYDSHAVVNVEFEVDQIHLIEHSSTRNPNEEIPAFVALIDFNLCVPESRWEANDTKEQYCLPAYCRFRTLYFAETRFDKMFENLGNMSDIGKFALEASLGSGFIVEQLKKDPDLATKALVYLMADEQLEMQFDGIVDFQAYSEGICVPPKAAEEYFKENLPRILQKVIPTVKVKCKYLLGDVSDRFYEKR